MMTVSVIRPTRLLVLIAVLLIGCTEPIDLANNLGGGQLVVEGSINDVDSVHVVRLSTSSFDGVGENTLGRNARVTITDLASDQAHTLNEVFPGSYETTPWELQGIIGQSYRLDIVLANGQSYASDAVTIPESIPVSNTEVKLLEERGTLDNGTPFVTYAHEVLVDFENSERPQYVRIESQGWIELFVDYGLCDEVLGGFGIPGELSCWQFRETIESNINTATNIGVDTDMYQVSAVVVPFDFRAGYVTELFINSMSLEAFAYWELAKTQLQRNGGIFDPPFPPVVGNVINTDGDAEPVLGYFHAYSQSFIRTCFDRTGIPGMLNIPVLDCLTTCEDFWAPAVFELPFETEGLCPI
ncbi:MAG: DUF4249 domain-containing protein [Cytophagales bacterium]|nr:DUF4249 domain-containing protein [Cytophagales bacterium]